MTMLQAAASLSRRRALKLGAGLAGGLVAANSFGKNLASAQDAMGPAQTTLPNSNTQNIIEGILDAKGTIVHNDVVCFEIVRRDLSDLSLMGFTVPASFGFTGNLYFQNVAASARAKTDYDVIVNGDLCVKAAELDNVVFSLLLSDFEVQAVHQFFSPEIWFVHFRNMGDPTNVARGIKTALDLTGTPFPQDSPAQTKTSLEATQMGTILGAVPQIGADGAVMFNIPRTEAITLAGLQINNYLNVATTVGFLPAGGSGNAAVLADIGALSTELNHVLGSMMKSGWTPGAVFNHQTSMSPQLTFAEFFKWGNAMTLAKEVRTALELTKVNLI